MSKQMRVCKVHGETEFRNESRVNPKFRCCKCCSESVQRRRAKVKQLAIEYKGGKCESCGYNKMQEVLEFHHRDPSQKDFGISAKGITWSFDRIKVELDKCIMLCANCHREEHVRLKLEV